MKTFSKIFFILVGMMGGMIVTAFISISHQVHISGSFYSDDKNVSDQFIGLQYYVKADNKIIAQTELDKNGHYDLTFIYDNMKDYDFFITGIGIDETFIESVIAFNGDKFNEDIKFPRIYNKKHGKIICPKCNKTDKVYPIIYGTPISLQIISANGDTT